MSAIEYRHNFPLTATDVAAVFDASGIRRPTNDLARIERMFANASLIFSAWHEGKLVGVCRALTDFSYCCYLSDLAVDKAFQKHGIGRFSENFVFDAALALNFDGPQSHRVEAFRRHKSSAWCPGGTFFLNQSRVSCRFWPSTSTAPVWHC